MYNIGNKVVDFANIPIQTNMSEKQVSDWLNQIIGFNEKQ